MQSVRKLSRAIGFARLMKLAVLRKSTFTFFHFEYSKQWEDLRGSWRLTSENAPGSPFLLVRRGAESIPSKSYEVLSPAESIPSTRLSLRPNGTTSNSSRETARRWPSRSRNGPSRLLVEHPSPNPLQKPPNPPLAKPRLLADCQHLLKRYLRRPLPRPLHRFPNQFLEQFPLRHQ